MRGRIVVAAAGSLVPEEPSPDLPGLPAVAEILRLGVVRRDPEARPAVGGHHG